MSSDRRVDRVEEVGDSSDQPDPGTRGIVLTHGSMCFGMVDAVQKIAGAPGEALTALSNEGRGPEELIRAVKQVARGGPAIIFTDLHTGSCALAARFACREPKGTQVVFGTNLPMLLDFVFHRHLPLDDLIARLIERGRGAIRSAETELEDRGNRPVSSG